MSSWFDFPKMHQVEFRRHGSAVVSNVVSQQGGWVWVWTPSRPGPSCVECSGLCALAPTIQRHAGLWVTLNCTGVMNW